MVEVLAYGTQTRRQTAPRGDRLLITYDGHTAVLSLYKFGNRETWLLTGWDDDASIPGVNSGASTSIGKAVLPSGGRAVDPDEITSTPLGADGKPLFHSYLSDKAQSGGHSA